MSAPEVLSDVQKVLVAEAIAHDVIAQNNDLRRRIDRTLAYIEELSPERLSSDARLTLDAVRRSLVTPSKKGSER